MDSTTYSGDIIEDALRDGTQPVSDGKLDTLNPKSRMVFEFWKKLAIERSEKLKAKCLKTDYRKMYAPMEDIVVPKGVYNQEAPKMLINPLLNQHWQNFLISFNAYWIMTRCYMLARMKIKLACQENHYGFAAVEFVIANDLYRSGKTIKDGVSNLVTARAVSGSGQTYVPWVFEYRMDGVPVEWDDLPYGTWLEDLIKDKGTTLQHIIRAEVQSLYFVTQSMKQGLYVDKEYWKWLREVEEATGMFCLSKSKTGFRYFTDQQGKKYSAWVKIALTHDGSLVWTFMGDGYEGWLLEDTMREGLALDITSKTLSEDEFRVDLMLELNDTAGETLRPLIMCKGGVKDDWNLLNVVKENHVFKACGWEYDKILDKLATM